MIQRKARVPLKGSRRVGQWQGARGWVVNYTKTLTGFVQIQDGQIVPLGDSDQTVLWSDNRKQATQAVPIELVELV